MQFNWNLLLMAIGIALVLEGIPYFLFAERMPSLFRMLAEKHPNTLRMLGLTAVLLGLGLALLAKRSI